jgi:hypothetical protein
MIIYGFMHYLLIIIDILRYRAIAYIHVFSAIYLRRHAIATAPVPACRARLLGDPAGNAMTMDVSIRMHEAKGLYRGDLRELT